MNRMGHHLIQEMRGWKLGVVRVLWRLNILSVYISVPVFVRVPFCPGCPL